MNLHIIENLLKIPVSREMATCIIDTKNHKLFEEAKKTRQIIVPTYGVVKKGDFICITRGFEAFTVLVTNVVSYEPGKYKTKDGYWLNALEALIWKHKLDCPTNYGLIGLQHDIYEPDWKYYDNYGATLIEFELASYSTYCR